MGSDDRISKVGESIYYKGLKTPKEDKELIHYLVENGQSSPFEMCELCFQLRLPIYVQRQLMTYRTANVNEASQRYTKAIDKFDTINYDESKHQNSQTNSRELRKLLDGIIGRTFALIDRNNYDLAKEVYEERLELGVGQELRESFTFIYL